MYFGPFFPPTNLPNLFKETSKPDHSVKTIFTEFNFRLNNDPLTVKKKGLQLTLAENFSKITSLYLKCLRPSTNDLPFNSLRVSLKLFISSFVSK